MRCRQVQALFSEWQEQRLEAPTAGQMRAHLEGCPACARELELFQATWRLLHTLPEVEPPLDFVARTLAALPWPSQTARREPHIFRKAAWRWAWAGGAMVMLLLGLAALWHVGSPENGAPVTTADLPSPPAELPQTPERRDRKGPEGIGRDRKGSEGEGGGQRGPAIRWSMVGPKSEIRNPNIPERLRPAPDPYRVALDRAEGLLGQGKAAEAIAVLEPAVDQAPAGAGKAAGYRQLARAYQATYRLEDALRSSAEARRLAPSGLTPPGSPPSEGGEEMLARQVLAEARALLAEGQSEDAARLSQAMLTHRIGESEQQATAVALIARCQSAQQQPELEQITLTRLASLFPASEPSATALWQVAQAQEQAGNAQEAAKTYQTLLAQSPAEKEELVLRAQAMKRAADLAARNGGDAQAVAARYAAAREALKQAQREAKEAPQVRDGRVLLEMAQVQEALQEKPKAIETLVELVQQYPNTDSARQAEARLEELI